MPSFSCEWLEPRNSPYINRFLQPDTIIPSAANPQSWNRYSYVLNTPINAVDPTGHKCKGEPEECLNDNGKPINGAGGLNGGGGDNGTLDPESLTSNCDGINGQCYDGVRMKELYDYYASHSGWWNDYQLNNFSVGQFLGMMMLFETSVAYNGTDWVIKAATLQIWGDASDAGGHGPYCTTVCENGVFNFMAKYIEAAWNRYDAIFEHVEHISREPIPNWNPETDRFTYPFPGYTEEKFMDFYKEKSNYISTQILNPNPADTIYTNDKPYHWGNYSNVGDAGSFYSFNGFYVFSQSQSNAAIAGGATLDQK